MTGIVGFTYSGDPPPPVPSCPLCSRLYRITPAIVSNTGSATAWHWGAYPSAVSTNNPSPSGMKTARGASFLRANCSIPHNLRAELEAAGHIFTLGSAAEHVLHLWEEYWRRGPEEAKWRLHLCRLEYGGPQPGCRATTALASVTYTTPCSVTSLHLPAVYAGCSPTANCRARSTRLGLPRHCTSNSCSATVRT